LELRQLVATTPVDRGDVLDYTIVSITTAGTDALDHVVLEYAGDSSLPPRAR